MIITSMRADKICNDNTKGFKIEPDTYLQSCGYRMTWNGISITLNNLILLTEHGME